MSTDVKTPHHERGSPIEAMKRPEFYPHRPATVELRQTHMSWAFLAGDFVYKVKKPVHFAFADAFTLQQRYLLCREEVRLNRRLAPDVYLGVVPIIDQGSRYELGDSADMFDPRVREYAVHMRRLPDDLMLDHQLKAGAIRQDAAMEKVAARVAALHGSAASAASLRYGSPAAVERTVVGNLQECRADIERLIGSGYEAIANYVAGFIRAHRDLLNERASRGRVREGHGDLRCEHVCMSDKIEIIDCVEFDAALRYSDVASDLAFLAMDLDAHGRPDLDDEFIAAYVKVTGDFDLPTLLNFYKCHRACIRGKVDALKALSEDHPAREREEARNRSRAKFELAARYARRGTPSLMAVCGMVASGKSTMANRLRFRTGFEVLNSDRVRKQLASVPEDFRSRSDYGAGFYSAEFDQLTYASLFDGARDRLLKGRGVILDASFKIPQHRAAVLALADEMKVPALFVECRTTEQETLRRLAERAKDASEVSDATADIYQVQKREYAPLSELPDDRRAIVDAGEDIESAMKNIEKKIAAQFESLGKQT
jgi:aminoglycoside phosphotransferase family enzyme/predicted kinase